MSRSCISAKSAARSFLPVYVFQPTCGLSSSIRGYSISGRIATCINGTLPPQPFFQTHKALVANHQVIDQLDVQVLARGN